MSAGFESLPGAAFTVRGAALPKNVALVTGEADFQVGPGLCTLVKFDSALALRANAIGGFRRRVALDKPRWADRRLAYGLLRGARFRRAR